MNRSERFHLALALCLCTLWTVAAAPCTEQQVYAVYGECDLSTKTRNTTFLPIPGLDCQPPSPIKGPCLCTKDDYTYIYGVCGPDNTRTVVFYLRPDANCVQHGGYTPPPPNHNLPCDLSCKEGEYYDPMEGCKACSAGSYSVGGGILVQNWSPIPTPFATSCRSKSYFGGNCTTWQGHGDYVDSGDNFVNGNIETILVASFQLVKAGYISFTYMVDAETYPYPYDYFTFTVDGNVVIPRAAIKAEWKTFSYNLTAGYHSVSWLYAKDTTMSEGNDRVYLKDVKIIGLSSYAEKCERCPPGSYSDAKSFKCILCPEDTFNPESGASVCQKCPSTKYSGIGASMCTDRPPCTEDDYDFYFTECKNHKREKVYEWSDGIICDTQHPKSAKLPARESNVDCATCNPGTFRPMGDACVPCPSGTYLSDKNTCVECAAGTAAVRTMYLTYFHEWPQGMSTFCDPPISCGTDGWRLRGTYIDSGFNHGSATVYLQYNVELETAGSLSFDFSSNCPGFTECSFNVYIDGKYASTYPSYNVTNKLFEFPLGVGPHSIVWMFKNRILGSPYHSKIDMISVTGAKTGGATACVNCPPGTSSLKKSEKCALCGAGTYSTGNATECTKCPADTYAGSAGSKSCEKCGTGSTSTPGSQQCTSTCRWSYDATHTYDLNPLHSAVQTTGPITTTYQKYFANICSRDIPTSTGCISIDGTPLNSYICQISLTASYNLGTESEFVAPAHGQDGFVIRYYNGDEGCYPRRKRTTEINFLCDPSAGDGVLSPVGPIENPPYSCAYYFQWKTRHACRLCTVNDYTSFYSDCVDGKRNRFYVWLQTESPCQGGVSLPDREIGLPCAPKVSCGPGMYLPVSNSPSSTSVCTKCQAGTYSAGTDTLLAYWTAMPASVNLNCNLKNCTDWYISKGLIKSGAGNSRMTLTAVLNKPELKGVVTFKSRVYTSGFGVLNFYINGELQDSYSEHHHSMFGNSKGFPLTKEYNELTWEFMNGTSTQFALLEWIRITGSSYAPSECSVCPPGYYSEAGASSCTPCAAGTYSSSYGSKSCDACPSGYFSFEGQSVCSKIPTCTAEDVYQMIGPCEADSRRNITSTFLQPKICQGGYQPPKKTRESCPSCKAGYLPNRVAGECIRCPNGESRPDAQQACVACTPGTAAVRSLEISSFDNELSEMNFKSWCDGDCGSTTWRPRNSYIDSGINHFGHFETHLEKTFDLYTSGSISFVVEILGRSDTFAWISVDDEHLQIFRPNGKESASIPLQSGKRTVMWGLYGSSGESYMKLSKIEVAGETTGASKGCLTCPVGHYALNSSSVACLPCEPGSYAVAPGQVFCPPCHTNHFSATSGAVQCQLCETGTYGSSPYGSTDCQTTCRYQPQSDLTYDISQLSQNGKPYVVAGPDSTKHYFSLCKRPSAVDSLCGQQPYACMATSADSHSNSGSYMKFALGLEGFVVIYSSGKSTKKCPSGLSTTIRFACDPNYEKGIPVYNATEECNHVVHWTTKYGCPVCKASDLKPLQGRCENGRRLTTHLKLSTCYGDEPKDIVEDCDEFPVPVMAVIGSVGVVVFLLVVVGVLWNRHRSISEQYTLLRSKTKGNVELATYESDSEEEGP